MGAASAASTAPSQLEPALRSARAEAREAFGDDAVLLEKLIELGAPRRGAGDRRRPGHRLGGRRARLQPPAPQPEGDRGIEQLGALARAGAASSARPRCGWRLEAATAARRRSSSSTSPTRALLSFMEVNTRLQVEHPVTEATTGLDLREAPAPRRRGRAARGRAARRGRPRHRGAAQRRGPGARLRTRAGTDRAAAPRPAGPGSGSTPGCREGDSIPAEFDSMIAKLIAWGQDRAEALARLRRALAETTIVIEGGTTNLGFLLELLARPERAHRRGGHRLARPAPASAARRSPLAMPTSRWSRRRSSSRTPRAPSIARASTPSRGVGARTPRLQRRAQVELRYRGQRYRLARGEIGPSLYRVTLDGTSVEVGAERLSPHERRLQLGGHGFRVVISDPGRGPADRGRRRSAPRLPRRRRARAQPGAGGRRLDPGRAWATRSPPATSSRWSRS